MAKFTEAGLEMLNAKMAEMGIKGKLRNTEKEDVDINRFDALLPLVKNRDEL